jgi:hypothetical protein
VSLLPPSAAHADAHSPHNPNPNETTVLLVAFLAITAAVGKDDKKKADDKKADDKKE